MIQFFFPGQLFPFNIRAFHPWWCISNIQGKKKMKQENKFGGSLFCPRSWASESSSKMYSRTEGRGQTPRDWEQILKCRGTHNTTGSPGEIKILLSPSPTIHRLLSHRTGLRSDSSYQTAMEMHFLMPKLTKEIQINPFFNDMVSFILLSLQTFLPNHI